MDEPFGALDPQTRWGMQSAAPRRLAHRGQHDPLRHPRRLRGGVPRRHRLRAVEPAGAHPSPRRRAVSSRARRRPEVGGRVPRRREAAARPALRAAAALHVECDRMSAPEKPSSARPTPPATPQTPTPPPQPDPAMASAIRDSAVDLAKSALFGKRPYLKFAFRNPYNLSLFFGALAAAGITLNPVLAIAALGAEALWLLYAPDSARLQHLLWDPQFERIRNVMLEQQRAERMTGARGSRARARAAAHRSPAGDPPPGGTEPLLHRRSAPRRAREDRQAGRRLHRSRGDLLPLRALPRPPSTSPPSNASAAAGRRRSGPAKAPARGSTSRSGTSRSSASGSRR